MFELVVCGPVIISLPNNLHQHPFPPHSIKFPVKDLFPGSKVQLSVGNRNHDFSSHDLPFHVCIGIVFVSIVPVLAVRFFGSKFFEPLFEVGVEAGFVVVDEDTGGDVHGVAEQEAFADAGFFETGFDLESDVEEVAAVRGLKE